MGDFQDSQGATEKHWLEKKSLKNKIIYFAKHGDTIIPVLLRQKWEDVCELKASLVYTMSYKPVRAI